MYKKTVILFFQSVAVLALCMLMLGGGKAVEAQTDGPVALPVDQLIIQYKAGANLTDAAQAQAVDQMQRLRQAAGIELSYFRPMSGEAHVLRLPERLPVEQVEVIARKLASLPEVAYAEPDYIVSVLEEGTGATPMQTPNDPQYSNQWHYFAPGAGHYGVDAPAAWEITTGSAGVIVAVLDTGITNHADLSGRWVGGYDMIGDVWTARDGDGRDSDPHDPGDWTLAGDCYLGSPAQDSSWHGTHVAGTIGAASNNGVGVAGLNWVSQVVPVRVLGRCGGYTSDIADGIRWAAGLSVTGVPANANPAKVINMSLGGYNASGCSTTYQDAITAAYNAGVVVVVAAGNENDNASLYQPGSCNNVITVAATNRDGGRAYYSNYGDVVEISGPGGAQNYYNDPNGVLSTLNSGATVPAGDAYVYYQGTSMAAPHVAGVASLMVSMNPSLTPAQVLSTLQSTVTPFPAGSSCNTSICGSGIVNAGAALAALQPLKTVYLPLVLKNYTSLPPGAFNKIAPANGATNQPVNPTLSWGTSSYAASYEYCMDTTNNSACDTSWISTGTNTSVGLSGLTTATTYYWQVRAVNGAGTTYANGSSTSYWSFTTVAPAPGFVNGDFELGSTGWTEYSLQGWDLILSGGFPGEVTPHSGSYAVWLGGDYNEVAYVAQQVTISAITPYLVYWHWIASEDYCGWDYGYVYINGSIVDSYNLCTTENTGTWVPYSVNLSAYIGQLVSVQIRVETDGSLNSNLFVDDVSLQSSPASADPTGSLVLGPQAATTQSKDEFGLITK